MGDAGALDRPSAEVPLPAIVKPLRSVSSGDGGTMRSSEVVHVETGAQLEEALRKLREGDWLVEPLLTVTFTVAATVRPAAFMACTVMV